MWTSDDEFSCRVDIVLNVVAKEFQHVVVGYFLFHAWHKYVDHVFAYFCEHGVVVGKLVVLC